MLDLETNPDTAEAVEQDRYAGDLHLEDRALLSLAALLRKHGYRFTCVTPETHARVVARRRASDGRDLRDVFGWSLPFQLTSLPADVVSLLREAAALTTNGTRHNSSVRFSSLERTLLVHSAWPTLSSDAVFFGPDTYRFVSLIEHAFEVAPPRSPGIVVDLGCGTGAGGIAVARLLDAGDRTRVLFTDINALALRYAKINALHAGVPSFRCLHSDLLTAVPSPIDVIVANPPYLLDAQQRAYRHGGGSLGTGLSLRIVEQALQRLAPGGQLILYTASPIVDGIDTLRLQLAPLIDAASARRALTYQYREIDPDVFGSELDQRAYARVERIAAVGLTLQVM